MKLSHLIALTATILLGLSSAFAQTSEKVSVDIQSLLSTNPAKFRSLFSKANKLENVDLYWSNFSTNGLKLCMGGLVSIGQNYSSRIGNNSYLEISRNYTYGNSLDCQDVTFVGSKGIVNGDLLNLNPPRYAIKEYHYSRPQKKGSWKNVYVRKYQLIDLAQNKVIAESKEHAQVSGGCRGDSCMEQQVDTSDFGTKKVNDIINLLKLVDQGNI